MGRRSQREARRPESAPAPAPAPAKSRRGGTGKDAGRTGAVNRVKFDTSHIVAIFRTDMNRWQREAWKLMGERRVTMLLGPAGTAKTHCAVARAMHELIVDQSVGKIVLVRPAVEAGEKLGFLPGDLKQKLDPYFKPVYDIMDDLVGSRGQLREQVGAVTETAAVGFLRGRTFKDTCVIVDEAQNCTWPQLKLIMSRLGRGSKMIVTGDPDQTDLPHAGRNALLRLCDNIKKKQIADRGRLACFEFPAEAIVRDEVVVDVLDAFDDGYGDDDDCWPDDDRDHEEVPSYGKNLTPPPAPTKVSGREQSR